MELIFHLLGFLFVVVIVVGASLFLVIDMCGRADYVKDKAPRLAKLLERRSVAGVLLLVAIFMLVGLGSEIIVKDIPEVPEPPVVKFTSADSSALQALLKTTNESRKACPTSTATSSPSPAQTAPIQGCVTAQRQFPAQMYIAGNDPQVTNAMFAVKAFLPLALNTASSEWKCQVKITAPNDNADTANTLTKIAAAVGCRVEYRPLDNLHPEIEQEALAGAEKDTVIVHAPKADKYDALAIWLHWILNVKRAYNVTGDQTVWLQIGPGFPWQTQNTYGAKIGAPAR
ncbi:MAG: hypothetical protein WAL71_13965 [Terriglobales bacterium]|jgi:hypothetical protein